MLLLAYNTKETEIERCFELPQFKPNLFHNIVWAECRGCKEKELSAVIFVIKNRLKSSDFPNNLDSILLENGQFAKPITKTPTIKFCQKVDSIFKQNPFHNYLYFANLSKIKNPKILKKIKSYKLHKIGNQHFY